jgi:hypothetical protein
MMKKILTTTLLVCCVAVCLAVIADLTGKWSGTIKTPDGNEFPLTYTFKVDGNKLTGTAESPQGEVAIDSGKVNGDMFTFQVNVNGMAIPHSGKYYGDSVGLDIDLNGQKIHTTLKHADK